MKKLLLMVLACVFVVVTCMAAQCQATTKKGTQCKRQASAGASFCWQHGGSTKAKQAAGYTQADVAKMQCKAITNAGTQCKRTAKSGSDYCWQHEGMQNVSNVSSGVAETTSEVSITTSVEKTTQTQAAQVQCDAITKKGTRCSRKALSGGAKCWQHAN